MNVSVVIPTYNRYEVLQRALRSVYEQSFLPKEVIVVDDGSTDPTAEIRDIFPEIKYYRQNNRGVSCARNLGVRNATSEWIAFLDSDDEWHKDKLKSHVEFHKSNPNMLISYTNEKWIRNGNKVKVPKKFHKFGGSIFKECLSHCIIAPSSVVMHKELFENVGYFDEDLEVCEDYDMWLRTAQKYEIGLIDKMLITKYGGADDQLSAKYRGMDRFRVKALEKLLSFELALHQEQALKEMLIHKYTLLLKGAVKYDRISQIDIYKAKIERYRLEQE